MTRRKFRKQRRQRTKPCDAQQCFRDKTARLTSRPSSGSRDNDDSVLLGSRDRSPESVLFESQNEESLCSEALSPEVLVRLPRTNPEAKVFDDDVEIGKIAGQKLDRCSSSLNGGPTDGSNKTADLTREKRSSADDALDEALRNTVPRSADLRSSESISDDVSVVARSENFREKRPVEGKSSLREDCESEITDSRYLITDKAPSLSDNLATTDCPNGPPSRIAVKTVSPTATSRWSRHGRAPGPVPLALPSGTAGQSELINNVRASLEELELVKSLVDASPGRNDDSRDNARVLDAALPGTTCERLIANWREFWKFLACLRRAGKMTCEDTERGDSLLSRCRRFMDGRGFSHTSFVSTSLSSTFCMYLSNGYKNSDCGASLDEEEQELDKDSIQRSERIDRIQHGSTTPCKSTLPPEAKRRRTCLTFEEHGTVGKRRIRAAARKIVDLIPEERRSDARPFPTPSSPSRGKTCWENCIAESTTTTSSSGVDLPTIVSDYDRFSLQGSCTKLRQMITHLTQTSQVKKLGRLVKTMHSENEKILCEMSEKMTRLSAEFIQMRMCTETTLNDLTTQVKVIHETSKKLVENNMALTQELKQLRETLEEDRLKVSRPSAPTSSLCPVTSSSSLLIRPPPSSSLPLKPLTLEPASLLPPPPPPLPATSSETALPWIQLTTPDTSKNNKSKTPTRKCSTPLLNRPSITVDDLLKVTLKKAPQSTMDNRRNPVPGSRGPVVSLEMLRNVKLRSAKRRANDPTGKSPRSGRIVKTRTASPISLSPILTSSEGNLGRILRQVDLNRPRRLLSASSSFRDFGKEAQSTRETLTHSQSHSVID